MCGNPTQTRLFFLLPSLGIHLLLDSTVHHSHPKHLYNIVNHSIVQIGETKDKCKYLKREFNVQIL